MLGSQSQYYSLSQTVDYPLPANVRLITTSCGTQIPKMCYVFSHLWEKSLQFKVFLCGKA